MKPGIRQGLVDYLQTVAEFWDVRGHHGRDLGGARAPGQCLPGTKRNALNRASWLEGGQTVLLTLSDDGTPLPLSAGLGNAGLLPIEAPWLAW